MSEEQIQTPEEVTGAESPSEQTIPEAADTQDIDYKTKFSESSKEALRLLEVNKEKERLLAEKEVEIERLRVQAEASIGGNYAEKPEALYPGFDLLPEEEQKNLIAFTESIKKGVRDEIYKDPSISFAKQSFNEKRWNEAFETVATKYPELREQKGEFQKKYFNPENVPTNIDGILDDLSKVFLFDKAKDLGAQEAMQKAELLDIERAGGGDNTPKASRSLEDWHRMAQESPQKFASMAKEYNQDLASGRLK